MATQSSSETLYGANFSPLRGEPTMGGIPQPLKTETAFTLSTGAGTTRTLTTAETLGGLLVINCDDAGTVTFPTTTNLLAAMPGAAVGQSFDLDVINVGDATITFAVGTGMTATVGNSKATVLTLALLNTKRFTIRISGMTKYGDSSDSCVLYGFGSVAASVA
jgi:hypothetical protein